MRRSVAGWLWRGWGGRDGWPGGDLGLKRQRGRGGPQRSVERRRGRSGLACSVVVAAACWPRGGVGYRGGRAEGVGGGSQRLRLASLSRP